MKKREIALRLGMLVFVAGLWLAGVAVAEAHDCSSPHDCEQTGGYNGALSAAGGAIAIATALIGSTLLGNGGSGPGGNAGNSSNTGGGGPGGAGSSAVPPLPPGGTVIDTRVVGGPEAIQTIINNGGTLITTPEGTFLVPPDNFPPGVHGGGWTAVEITDPTTGRTVSAIPPGGDAAVIIDWPHPADPPVDSWVDPNSLIGRGFPPVTIGGTTYVQPPENLPPNLAGGAWGTTEIPDPAHPGQTITVVNPNEPAWVSEWPATPPTSPVPPVPPAPVPSVPPTPATPVPPVPSQPVPPVPLEPVPPVPPEPLPPEPVPPVPPMPPAPVPPVPEPVPPAPPEPVPPVPPEPVPPVPVPPVPPEPVAPVPPEPEPPVPPEPVAPYVPPGVDTLDTIKKATDDAKDFVDKLPIDDETKQAMKDKLDQVGEPAGKGSEYIKALDDNLKETEGKGYPEGAREFLAWWRVLGKGAGEAGENYLDGQLSALPDDVKKKIHEAVPIKEFGEELSKFPTSSARHIRGGVQGEINRAENRDVLDEIDPNSWGQP